MRGYGRREQRRCRRAPGDEQAAGPGTARGAAGGDRGTGGLRRAILCPGRYCPGGGPGGDPHRSAPLAPLPGGAGLHLPQRLCQRAGQPLPADAGGRLHHPHAGPAQPRLRPAAGRAAQDRLHLPGGHPGGVDQRPHHGQRHPGHHAEHPHRAVLPHGESSRSLSAWSCWISP